MAHTHAQEAESPIKDTDVQCFLQGIRVAARYTEYTVADALCAYEANRESVLTELRIRKVQENIRNKICGEKNDRVDLVFHRNTHSDIASGMSCLLSEDGDSDAPQPGDPVPEDSSASQNGSVYDSISKDVEYSGAEEPTLFLSSVADIYNQDVPGHVEYAEEVTETAVDDLAILNATQDLIRRKLEKKEERKKFGFEQLM